MAEYVSPEGLRLDGRRPLELRRMQCRFGVVREAEGSVTFESGNTQILAAAFGPRDQKHRTDGKTASVYCQVSAAPFSTGERRKRSRRDRLTRELAQVVKGAVQTIVLTELFPGCRIDVFLHVLQADGGILSAALNATVLAVADAGIPMHDCCGAVSFGLLENTILLDVNHLEESAGGALATVLIQRRLENVVTLHLERGKLNLDQLEEGMSIAKEGAKATAAFIRERLLERTRRLATARGSS